jgi:hypothetical protein
VNHVVSIILRALPDVDDCGDDRMMMCVWWHVNGRCIGFGFRDGRGIIVEVGMKSENMGDGARMSAFRAGRDGFQMSAEARNAECVAAWCCPDILYWQQADGAFEHQ